MIDIWEGLKHAINLIVIPIVGAIWYGYKKHMARMDEIEKRTTENEKAIAVMQSQMKDIKLDIDEIKAGINKILDKLCK